MKVPHYIYIKTKVYNKNRILMKLYKNHINVYDIVERNQSIYLKVLKEDYEIIKKKIVTVRFYYVDDAGIFHLKKTLTPLKIFPIVLFLFLTNFFSHFIIQVDVIHSNKEIRSLVTKAIEEENLKVGSIKKDYSVLQDIKQKILTQYKEQLEWIEIESLGMKYTIRIEERIRNAPNTEEKFCHIVAGKSGILSSITSTKGEVLVSHGKYVSEGEILISGEIKYNEEIKNNVCAEGNAFAEVWYQTTVHLPIVYSEKKRTGKKRINFALENENGKYKILKSRLSNYDTEEKVLFRFFNFTFYKLNEYEIVEEEKNYDLENGLQKAIALADEKISTKLGENEKINLRKVLKKNKNDSTIDVELFYSVIENISKRQEFFVTTEEEGS